MQKLYLTKCAIMGLSLISASISAMETRSKRASQKTNAEVATTQQELAINSYVKRLAKKRADSVDALQQENCILMYTRNAIDQERHILWYTNINAEKTTADAIKIAQHKLI